MYTEHTERFVIRHHECGAGGIFRLKDLLDHFQDAAADHATKLGVGLEAVQERRTLWVLSRLKIRLERKLSVGEPIVLTTYPSGAELLFATRQFTMQDCASEIVARGTSCWLLLHADTFRPLRPMETLPESLLDCGNAVRHFPTPGKLRPVEGSLLFDVTVRETDIDENDHLNNAQYGRYIADAVAAICGRGSVIRELQINFNHQAMAADRLFIFGMRDTDGMCRMEGRSEDGKICYFQAECSIL